MLKGGLETSLPSQIKSLLGKFGMPYSWNSGLFSSHIPAESGNSVLARAGFINSTHHNQAKSSFGEEVYFNFNIPAMILRLWIQLRVNCLPIQNRQKMIDKHKR